MAEREYAPLPYEYLDEMEELNDAEFGRLARALLKYSMTGELIALSGNERFYARRVMNRENRYRESFEQKREAGAKGGSKNKQPQADESNCKQPQADESNCKQPQADESNCKQPQADESNCKQPQADESKPNNTNTKANTKANTNTPSSDEEGSKGAERPPAFESEELQSAFADWLAYRAELRKPYKSKGLQALEAEIRNKAAEHGEAAVAAQIRKCMASGYQGIFLDRLERGNNQHTKGNPTPSRSQAERDQTAREDMERMRRMLEQMREDEPCTV